MAVLDGMKLGPFKAILAHEYGHFSNKDTAGGGFALAVRRSLINMAQGLGAGGVAQWYNPAWLFLNGFYRVFLRISQGASRLQEVLADRWAAFSYGAEAFERGLRHVIERSAHFDLHSYHTLNEVMNQQKALVNLYSYRPAHEIDEEIVERKMEEAINADPSPYDSHPSPVDRFAWVQALQARPTGNLTKSETDVWGLLPDREEIERMMTAQVQTNIRIAHELEMAAEAEAAG